MSNYLSLYNREQLSLLVKQRPAERKLGEEVQCVASGESLEEALLRSSARFFLLGIPEDIGVRANGGVGGAWSAWKPALSALLNIQSTSAFGGQQLFVLGAFEFTDWLSGSGNMSLDELRTLTARIDDEVYPVIRQIVRAGKIPILIGGGHNNAFPLLKGSSLALEQSLSCINLDAHSDYRIMEGRHSGNGFRYAKALNYLDRYAITGLHEHYNSAAVMADIETDASIRYSTFEDIFLRGKQTFDEALTTAISHTAGTPCGIELDLDCIEGVLSSAMTPTGLSSLLARRYVTRCAAETHAVYLHLTEGATELSDGRVSGTTGKLIACLVSDFIKAYEAIHHG